MARAELTDDQVTELIKESVEAQNNAYNLYSKFPVGAAILTKEGKTYKGCNVENASYSLCICAERVAMFKAVSDGHREFVAIAVSGAKEPSFIRPCGSCRQVMAEFNPDMNVYMTKPDGTYEISTVADLLPKAFIL